MPRVAETLCEASGIPCGVPTKLILGIIYKSAEARSARLARRIDIVDIDRPH